ncbi:hypothetical protein V6N12_012071 [Hibiscus sabdariffa]|uniref:Uncharacterized protein n=1 Tax=Hibiscus sabdariffa TaxID=183260 RepID=A0ABR2CH28_9ROSI
MWISPLDGPRLFLWCPYEMEGQSLSLMRVICEELVRSTECRAFSILCFGFSFPLRPPPKPLFPMVILCSWFMFDEGKLCLFYLSTAYGNIILVFLAAIDDSVCAVGILHSVAGSQCSPRFSRFCSYDGEVIVVSPGSKSLRWFQPFHCLILMIRSLYLTYRETILRPWSSLRNYSMIKD